MNYSQMRMTDGTQEDWKPLIDACCTQSYMLKLFDFLQSELRSGTKIYPDPRNVFAAFRSTSFSNTKVVILGQDPYHGPGQAHGLSFSVPAGIKTPPSLRNIFKELETDLGTSAPREGCLESWANQGVLLLNSVLTVEAGKAGSHQQRGWEIFTDQVLTMLNKKKRHTVFVLWGAAAKSKGQQLDRANNLVIESSHPSPLSSYRGFIGSRPFSAINRYFASKNIPPINWSGDPSGG